MNDRIPIEIGTREEYARWAATYDTERNGLIALEEQHTRDLLADLPRRAVLDLAAGTGRHALKLASDGVRTVALDQSPEMIAVGRRTAAAVGATIEFVLARIDDDLPFRTGSFDLIVCGLALCHLTDIATPMQECARLLHPGGHLLLTDFHPTSVASGLRTTFSTDEATYWLPNAPHSRQDYLDAATGVGFDLRAVRDLPVRDIPPGAARASFIEQYGDTDFCLLILAQRR